MGKFHGYYRNGLDGGKRYEKLCWSLLLSTVSTIGGGTMGAMGGYSPPKQHLVGAKPPLISRHCILAVITTVPVGWQSHTHGYHIGYT